MNIPETQNALVLRTDFSDDSAWESLCAAIRRPVGIFLANVEFVSDSAFAGLAAEQVLALIPQDSQHTFLFIVDDLALTHPDHPILVMDVFWERGRTFRVIPSEMWSIENNLSLGNMDFEDFADSVDADGVFRGFPMP
jgi:hypothetical protein